MTDRASTNWPTLKEWDESQRRMIEANQLLSHAIDRAIEALREYEEQTKWLRFDTVIGPLIGAAIMGGVVLIAAIAGWLS